MDNGAAEGLGFGVKHLYTVAEAMEVDEIVVPDVLGDWNETIARGLAFTRHTRDGYRYMAVAQGQSVDEIMRCIDMYMTDTKFMYVTCIGIPRLANRYDPNARVKISEMIATKGWNVAMEFHYLGASGPFVEVEALAATGVGRGIDTSAPVYMAQKGLVLERSDVYLARPDNFFSLSRINAANLLENIEIYLEWANYDYNTELPEKASVSQV